MKRYLLFVFDDGYDSYNGAKGWEAFEGDFDDAQKAAATGARSCEGRPEYAWHVVDTSVKEIVLSGRGTAEPCDPPPSAEEIAEHPERRPTSVRMVP